MASNPLVRERIIQGLRETGCVQADRPSDARFKLGMGDVSSTQFMKALNSLLYNPAYKGKVVGRRRNGQGYGVRPITLALRPRA